MNDTAQNLLEGPSQMQEDSPCTSSSQQMTFGCGSRPRRPASLLAPDSLVLRLRNRETFSSYRGDHLNRQRRFYEVIVPNLSLTLVDKPNCFMRKFSPDGQFLLAFSSEQSALELYRYRGVNAVGSLIQERGVNKVDVFRTMFDLHARLDVSQGTGIPQLNRECSLFTGDSRYVIVAASTPTSEDVLSTPNSFPHPYFVYRSNESLELVQVLDDYTIYTIRVADGVLVDQQQLKCDKIVLSHNQGIYLCDETLAILSQQHQSVYIYHLSGDGQLSHMRTIGRFLSDFDEILYNSSLTVTFLPAGGSTESRNLPLPPMVDPCFNSLKHRILTFLYRQAKATSDQNGDHFPLRNFYRHFEYFRLLRLWKMQLLDSDHLLLKLAAEDVVLRKPADSGAANAKISYFVIFEISSGEVLAIYENVSEAMLDLYEKFGDDFRNIAHPWETQFPCSVSSSAHARRAHERLKMTIINAKNGGKVEAIRRLLSTLPLSAQSFSASPYLDPELFSYDDKWISVMERPKACGDFSIKFFGRRTGTLSFELSCLSSVHPQLARPSLDYVLPSAGSGPSGSGLLAAATGAAGAASPANNIQSPPNSQGSQTGPSGYAPPGPLAATKPLVAFLFHPSDPFAISIQRPATREYIINLHLRVPFCDL